MAHQVVSTQVLQSKVKKVIHSLVLSNVIGKNIRLCIVEWFCSQRILKIKSMHFTIPWPKKINLFSLHKQYLIGISSV